MLRAMPERFVLVLAGGRGERFWPWSRPERPKQLLPLGRGGRTLLAATLERALRLVPADHVLVLTAQDLVEPVRRECPSGVRILGEPVGRNTAPAIGLAAAMFRARARDAAFAVMPSDHLIDDLDAFATDLQRGFEAVERDAVLLTFGIRPGGPDTNFGYVQRGARIAERLHRVAAFQEKPDRATAERYVASGDFFWNSGIFLWGANTFLNALEATRPALAAPLAELGAASAAPRFEAELGRVFPTLEAISVDYAVLEHAPNVLILEAAFDWDDLGSWGAWARRQPHDARGNVVFGQALALDCDRCVIVGEGGTAAAMGLADMVVVHADGATLSCRIDQTEHVRRVTEAVRARRGTTS
jgi:mannose-1-phosphate guanylyltransferase